MKRAILLSISVSLAVLLTACGTKITSGEVVEKNFSPAHSTVMVIPLVRSNGKTTSTTLVPFIYHYPDTWTITIGKYSERREEMLYATYRVTKDVFDVVEVGAEFIYDETMEPEEQEYTRERK